MALCEKCRNIFAKAEPCDFDHNSLRYPHYNPWALTSSATTCELCALFLNVLLDSTFGENSLAHWFRTDPIKLCLSNEGRSQFTSEFGTGSNITCIELVPHVKDFSRFLDRKSTFKLDVYAQLGK